MDALRERGFKADLRVATTAYADVCGPAPAKIVGLLDRFVSRADSGVGTTAAVVALHPATGELRLCSAGHCPPLVVESTRSWFLHDTFTPAIARACARFDLTTRLEPEATLLLFTDGLVERHDQPLALGLLRLQDATRNGPRDLGSFCDDVLRVCLDRRRREDDVTLLAIRRGSRWSEA